MWNKKAPHNLAAPVGMLPNGHAYDTAGRKCDGKHIVCKRNRKSFGHNTFRHIKIVAGVHFLRQDASGSFSAVKTAETAGDIRFLL